MAAVSSTAPSLAAAAEDSLERLRPQHSLWSNAWRRLRKNKAAMIGIGFLMFLVVVAIFAPWIAPHNPVRSDVAHAGTFRQAAWVTKPNPLQTGSWSYVLGTDAIGRDVFSRMVYGARVSIVVGFIPMLVIMIIGIPLGLAAGYAGGRLDNLLMRITDVVYAFPALLLAIVMQISFGATSFGKFLNGLVLLFFSISIVNWTGVARLVRGETMSLREREFVESARASGATALRIILRHILPNALGPIIVAAAYIIPGAIISEAILSYLGVGVRPSVDLSTPFPTSWGQMILDGSKTWQAQSWMLIAPSLAVGLITLSFTFLGDGLRDALDPRQTD